MIALKHIQLALNGQPILNDISFEIRTGECLVLLGPSGSGKTTLLKTINRLIEPDSGEVLFCGNNIQSLTRPDLRQQIGYVLQHTALFPHMTVAQNIAVALKLMKMPKAERQHRIDELLVLMHMDPKKYKHRYPHELSGGQQQRVGVARALATKPKCLLMDEPFAALDNQTRSDLQGQLKRLQQRLEQTIVFVTHDLQEAMLLGDRIAILQGGNIIELDTPENLMHSSNHFVQEFLIQPLSDTKHQMDALHNAS